MACVADLHIHSRFARACSRDLNIPNLAKWAKFKGIDVVGTGDALHPLWQEELKKDLKDAGRGAYEYDGVKFIVTTEVACIYSENGRVYRIHLLILLPSLESANRLSQVLAKKGANLNSDGRPILGFSSKQLCDLIFQIEPKAIIIPAHIWTPWFSLYGSNSGYNKLEDCFGDFSGQVFAVETGLSSEPAMNWRVPDLDKRSIVSFSDLHSLPRMGREVTIFAGDGSFNSLYKDLQEQNIIGTIEFFPEEGKYHYSGHRDCGVTFSPKDITEKGETCPVCKKRLTIGVMQRVEQLSKRRENQLQLFTENGITKSKTFPNRPGFRQLVQLEEILSEALETAVSSQKVKNEYFRLVTGLDNELKILTKIPIENISKFAGEKIADGVFRVREGKIVIKPGFDNTYGVIKIWPDDKNEVLDKAQMSFF